MLIDQKKQNSSSKFLASYVPYLELLSRLDKYALFSF